MLIAKANGILNMFLELKKFVRSVTMDINCIKEHVSLLILPHKTTPIATKETKVENAVDALQELILMKKEFVNQCQICVPNGMKELDIAPTAIVDINYLKANVCLNESTNLLIDSFRVYFNYLHNSIYM